MEKRKLATTLFAAASLITSAASVQALPTFFEPADAGQTLATATPTAANASQVGQALTTINGSMTGTNGLDADIYILRITNTSSFSATVSSALDTSIFLFNSTGQAVLANDDGSAFTLDGAIPAGNPALAGLSAGIYYLAVSLSGNEPVNLNSQLLFTGDQPTTGVRGAAGGVNPTTLSSFDGGTFFAEGGAYSIALTSAAASLAPVPEPSSVALLAVGGVASLALLRRQRRQQKA